MHGGMADEFCDWYKRVTNFFFENTFVQVFSHFFFEKDQGFFASYIYNPTTSRML
jgi:hypothetical protein